MKSKKIDKHLKTQVKTNEVMYKSELEHLSDMGSGLGNSIVENAKTLLLNIKILRGSKYKAKPLNYYVKKKTG